MDRLKKEGPVKIKAFGQHASGPLNDPGMLDDHQLLADDWHYREGNSVPLMLGDPDPGQYCTPGFMGCLVSLMGIYSIKDENRIWEIRSKQMVDRLQDLVIEKGDYASLPMASIAPGAVIAPDMAMATGTQNSFVFRLGFDIHREMPIISNDGDIDDICARRRTMRPDE